MTLYGNRIAQRIHDTSSVFENDPVSGERSSFTAGSIERTDQAARAAAEVFKSYDGRTTRTERAEFLRTIAAEIATRGPQITAMGVAETGLPAARRKGERGRTTGQLRLFAEHIETADYLNVRHDAVVTGCGLHRGTFSLLNDGGSGNAGADSRSVGAALVQSPHIKAVGFTGSLRGGRALYDLACSRAEPIPFFGELGSVNPVFILPAAARAPGAQLGKDWAGSLTLGVGQFCTDPGIVIMPAESAKVFEDAAFAARADVAEPLMLTTGIASAYRNVVKTLVAHPGVRVLQSAEADGRSVAPVILTVNAEDFIANPELAHEVFGPVGIIVVTRSDEQMQEIARSMGGQLTTTLRLEDADHPLAAELLPELEKMAGRIQCTGFPTGVEVADAMMHGGPYPASTNSSSTS